MWVPKPFWGLRGQNSVPSHRWPGERSPPHTEHHTRGCVYSVLGGGTTDRLCFPGGVWFGRHFLEEKWHESQGKQLTVFVTYDKIQDVSEN